MAGGVDTSKYKPRRTRGTPSYIIRNRFGYAVLGIGVTAGLIFHLVASSADKTKNVFEKYLLKPTEAELDRRALIGLIEQKRGEDILKIMEHKKQLDFER